MKGARLSAPIAAAVLGAMAGMRSMSAPAFLSGYFAREFKRSGTRGRWRLLYSPDVATTLKVLAAGELVADKLPFVPRRTAPASLVVRALSGALVGAALATHRRRPAAVPALIAAVAAIASSVGAFHARRALGRKLRLHDFAIAVAEDAVVLAAGATITRTSRAANGRDC